MLVVDDAAVSARQHKKLICSESRLSWPTPRPVQGTSVGCITVVLLPQEVLEKRWRRREAPARCVVSRNLQTAGVKCEAYRGRRGGRVGVRSMPRDHATEGVRFGS
jgi:hypothetical protein